MEKLSFEKLPHYFFSANRQFEENEYHMDRVYELSVLLLIRKGVLRFTENGVPVEVSAGEYYIQKAGIQQRGVAPSDAPNYYFIHFRGHYSKAGALPLKGKFNIDVIQPIISEMEMLGAAAEKLEYESLFYKLLCALKSNQGATSVAETLRTYILEHYTENLTLDNFAKFSLLSKNQTINVFKDTYGATPHKFLVEFRLKKAGELILATDYPINEICFAVGFTEYSGFYKAFFRKYGASPQDFRNKHSTNALPEDIYFNP